MGLGGQDANDAEAADDFTIPAGQSWTLTKAFVDGRRPSPFGSNTGCETAPPPPPAKKKKKCKKKKKKGKAAATAKCKKKKKK